MVTIVAAPTTGKYEATDRLFTCPIHWVVTGATSGFIVQHIQRNEKYKAGEEDVISALDYWEAWHIELDGSATPISHGINDNFGVYVEHTCLDRNRKQVFFPSKKDTKGKWKIRGTVYYVPEASFVVQQWFRDKDPATGPPPQWETRGGKAARSGSAGFCGCPFGRTKTSRACGLVCARGGTL